MSKEEHIKEIQGRIQYIEYADRLTREESDELAELQKELFHLRREK